jgi:hypothetical protein
VTVQAIVADLIPVHVEYGVAHVVENESQASELTGKDRPIAQDQVIAAMSDQSGYFTLAAPAAGWTPGLYRCGLFAGERTSAYTHVDEIRFRILEPIRPS